MAPTVAYIGKHSKDKVLSVYLARRVYVDEGDGIDPVVCIVRLNPKRLGAVGSNQGATRVAGPPARPQARVGRVLTPPAPKPSHRRPRCTQPSLSH